MFTALIVLGCVVAYLQTGYQLGKKSWRVWHSRKSGTAAWLLFPLSAHRNSVGVLAGDRTPVIDDFSDEEHYRVLVGFLWPLKLVMNATMLVLIGAYYCSFNPSVFKLVIHAFRAPGRLFDRLRERKRLATSGTAEPRIDEDAGEKPCESEYARLHRKEKELRVRLESVRARKEELKVAMGSDAEKALLVLTERH